MSISQVQNRADLFNVLAFHIVSVRVKCSNTNATQFKLLHVCDAVHAKGISHFKLIFSLHFLFRVIKIWCLVLSGENESGQHQRTFNYLLLLVFNYLVVVKACL